MIEKWCDSSHPIHERLSGVKCCFFFFHLFFSSDNLLSRSHLSVLAALQKPSLPAQTPSARHGKIRIARDFPTLNSNPLSVTCLLVRAPEQGSVRPTYSFVHVLSHMSVADGCGDHTISSGAGGPNTKRSLCRQDMDHRV